MILSFRDVLNSIELHKRKGEERLGTKLSFRDVLNSIELYKKKEEERFGGF